MAPVPGTDLTRQRAIADAFLAAARHGDFGALLDALDPDVVVRSNGAEAVRGAAAVARRAFPFTRIAQVTLPALINGATGVVTAADGRPITLVAFTITGAKIVAIDLIDDPPASLKPTWPSSAVMRSDPDPAAEAGSPVGRGRSGAPSPASLHPPDRIDPGGHPGFRCWPMVAVQDKGRPRICRRSRKSVIV